MAGVFLAVARGPVSDFHKLVVLKRLHESLREDAGFVRMFVREAKIAARLNHPNVVHTYSVDVEAGQPVIVMEYLDGVSLSMLKKRVRDRPLEERLPILGVIAQVLAGLHYVHELTDYDGSPMGLVHRDIKPANVFITFDGQVKVLDFGIAKATAPGQENTNSRVLKGTARYMAPEAVGGGSIDRRADIFSTGVMLWEAASGQRLWEGDEELQIIRRLMDNDVPAVDSVSPDTPSALTEMCRRALQLDPENRQQTAAELRTALLSFLNERGLGDIEASLRAIMVAEFSDRRAERAATIRERLAETSQTSTPGADDVRTLPGGSSRSTVDPISAPSAATSAPPQPVPRRGLSGLAVAGLVSVALGGLGMLAYVSTRPPAGEPQPGEVVDRSSEAEAAPSKAAPAPAEPAPEPKPEPAASAEPEPEPEPRQGLAVGGAAMKWTALALSLAVAGSGVVVLPALAGAGLAVAGSLALRADDDLQSENDRFPGDPERSRTRKTAETPWCWRPT
jgi:serine/threonine-protein kinase